MIVITKGETTMSTTTLWSIRWSPARGKHVVAERKCELTTAAMWIEIFQKDEPAVQFVLSERKPRV